jgi:hypothetical protein
MIGDKKTPRSVLESAYQKAVRAILIEIFRVDTAVAEEMVSVWWVSLSKTSAVKSGIFLHADPIQTASELCGSEERDLTEDEQIIYRRILRSSMDAARSEHEPERANDQFSDLKQSVQSASPRSKGQTGSSARRVLSVVRN